MLEKHLYDSWKSRMELYMMNRPHGRMILASVEKGPLVWPSITEDGVTRLKEYVELTPAEAIQADCDIKAINIILQGLPTEIYALVSQHRMAKDLWEKIKLLMQGTSLTKQERKCKLYDEFDKFTYKKGETLTWSILEVTLLLNDMFISKMPLEQFQTCTYNVDQLHAYLQQHERHANEVRLMHARNSDPLALVASHQLTQPAYQSHLHTHPKSLSQLNFTHSVFTVSYQQQQPEFSQPDSSLVVLVFQKGDDPIDAINHMMSFLTAVVTSRKYTPGASGSNTGNKDCYLLQLLRGGSFLTAVYLALRGKGMKPWFKNKLLLVQAQSSGQALQGRIAFWQIQDFLTFKPLRQNAQMHSLSFSGSNEQYAEIVRLKQNLFEQVQEKDSLMKIVSDLKNDLKMEENRNIDREIALEKKIKQLDNSFQKSEHAYWKATSVPALDLSHSSTTVIVEVPKELPKVSMVNTSLKELKRYLTGFDQEQGLVIAALKNELRKLKGKAVDKEAIETHYVDINVSKDNMEPITPKLLNKRTAHSSYIKHTQEEALVLGDIVKLVKANYPHDLLLESAFRYTKVIQDLLSHISRSCPSINNFGPQLVEVIPKKKDKEVRFVKTLTSIKNTKLDLTSNIVSNTRVLHSTGVRLSTSACGSQPSGNTRNDRIPQTPSSNSKNKVEAHPRNVKSSLNKRNGTVKVNGSVSVQNSKKQDDSDYVCVNSNDCMSSDNLCVSNSMNVVKFRAKPKQHKSKKAIWKPTGKVFTQIGYIWRPTGRTFTIVGNACPLTRITTTNEVPSRKPIVLDSESPKPVVKLVYSRKPRKNKNTESVSKTKVVQIVLWYLDSGCSKHMTGDRSQLTNFISKFLGTVKFGNDQVAKIMGFGDYQIGNVTISRVYYVEGLGHNLFSVGQFCDSNLEVAFRQHTCFIRNLEGVDLLTGSRGDNLYTLSLGNMMASSPICLLSKASKTKSWLWHRRLSHLNFGSINHLARHGLVRGLPKLKFEKDHLCSACALGKSSKKPHKPKSEDISNTNQEKLDLVHQGLCWANRVASVYGKKHPKQDSIPFYNRRTRRIIETIHVDFDELTAMASEHSSSGPALHEMTPVTISSGLVPNPPSSTPFVPPSRSDWDLLFQPMFDESLNPPPYVDLQAPEVIAPILEAVAPEHAVSTEDNHDIEVAHMGNDPYFGIPIPEVTSDQSSSSDVIHTIVPPDHQALGSYAVHTVEKARNCYWTTNALRPRASSETNLNMLLESQRNMANESCDPHGYSHGGEPSKPDLQFAICMCARYQARPTEKHLNSRQLLLYKIQRRSTSGKYTTFGDRLVTGLEKQKSDAISQTEAEILLFRLVCAQSFG
ncbi:retrovirus-related pol polyprotein from transposon TNT 1-94 [Tanacetum coccineum]